MLMPNQVIGFRRLIFLSVFTLIFCVSNIASFGQNGLSVVLNNPSDSAVDGGALLLPQWSGSASGGSLFGRFMNGVAHQSSPVLTAGNYQYSTWYRFTGNENVILARRDLNDLSSGWSTFDTGLQLIHGDANDPESGSQTQPWDNHNAINIGVSGDGRLHLSYDHHGNQLNYIFGNAVPNTWDRLGVFGTTSAFQVRSQIQNSLNGGPPVNSVTYPRFATNSSTGEMVMTFRLGGSGAGDLYIANYDPSSQTWSNIREFITGNDGVLFIDGIGNASSSRNPYLNNITFSPNGDLHTSFTWRETANGTANHNLNYIRSTDGGQTWLNDSGDLVAGIGQTVSIMSPGIIIDSDTDFITPFVNGGSTSGNPLGLIDRNQTLMNQQSQTVDINGGFHVLMWSRENPATHDPSDRPFDTTEAAHVHYYKAPDGTWVRNVIPRVDEAGNPVQVGTRPQIVTDSNGNAFAAYSSPGVAADHNRNFYDPGSLVIAGATASSGYTDWTILYKDDLFFNRFFEGEPLIDQQRLLVDGVLSVYLQEGSSTNSLTNSDLHIFDFTVIEEIETESVPAATVDGFRGVLVSGTASDIANSNDSYLVYQPGFTLNSDEAPVWLIFDAELTANDATELELSIETQANTPGLNQTTEIFNWTTGEYEQVDVQDASFNSDSVTTTNLSGQIDDFVSGSSGVRARTGWRRTGFTILFPWSVSVDQVLWNATY